MSLAALPQGVRRNIALGAPEAWGTHRTFDVVRPKSCSVCGICLAAEAEATSCTVMDREAHVVLRKKTEICKSVCIGRHPIRMLTNFIKILLASLYQLADNEEAYIRISLQTERDGNPNENRATQPYLLDAIYADGSLELGLLKEHIDDFRNDFFINPYQSGEEINLSRLLPTRFYTSLKRALQNEFLEAAGKTYSLVVQSLDLPRRDIWIGGTRIRYEEPGAYRAYPLFLFIQAE